MIKVVYACNDRLFDGLYLSILSILKRSKETFSFYLMTADGTEIDPTYTKLTDEHFKVIEALVKEYNANNSFTLIDCKDKYHEFVDNNKNTRCSMHNILRSLIDSYDSLTGKVIYLNVNTMACGDIKELYDVDVNDHEFAVCHNKRAIRWYQRKNYFNADVVLFNMDYARKTNLFKKIREMLSKNKSFNIWQKVMFHCASKYCFFPSDEYRFNRQTSKIGTCDIIKNFTNTSIYPLLNNRHSADRINKRFKIDNFNDDFIVYKAMKEKLKNEMKDEYFLTVHNLRKTYGTLKAVNDVSFKVKKGSLFAFLGINGAGKSTTINIISSTLPMDSGRVTVDSFDLETENSEVKKRIGIVFQNSVLDSNLSVEENLIIRGKFYNLKKDELNKAIAKVTAMLKLEPIMKQAVSQLSGGQRRRVDIARALLHEPKLLILDEPTTGLDPKTRTDVWNLIDDIRKRTNMTVFLTTHYLEEAEKASYIVIINKGKIIAEGTANDLKNKYSSDKLYVYMKADKDFEKAIKDRIFSYNKDKEAYIVNVKNSEDAKYLINKHDNYIKDFEIQKGDMDDVFLNVTGIK